MESVAAWSKPGRAVERAMTVAALTVALLLSLTAIDDFDSTTQRATFVFTPLLLAHLIGQVINLGLRPSPSIRPPAAGVTDQGEPGQAFRYARWPAYWGMAGLALGAAFMTLFAVDLGQAGGAAWALAVVFAGFGLAAAACVVVELRLAPGMVVLTPTGIYHRASRHEHFVPWPAVTDVLATERRRMPCIIVRAAPADGIRLRRYLGPLAMADKPTLMIIPTYWLGANAVPAYRAMRYYFEHPDERPALGAPHAAGS
ncbi:hypothetical protein [Actinoplanes sp. NPDC026619]|uniref:hypothetical protein n=1 Tax=Actinoplanes sp. NPDC026619 TaxID=3155798 RepID=UPI0033EDD671